ncbi:MAG: bacterial Ig-like domain-containing protein, partial [Methanomassiliicoccaceae archaeon]|nr:bacterial Ig-like domain-containing protein [Methanomassiliicoccaceae archaeon]
DGTSFVYLLDADAKTVTAGSQNGTIEEGSTDSAVFEITTANIASGKFMTVKWYEADGLTATTAPIGITAGTSAILNNTAVLTMTSDPASVAGTYYFTVTAAGVESVVVTLTVDPVTIPPMLDGITVSSTPDKTSYTVGDVLDLTGLEITATYSDGSSAEVTGYTTDPAGGAILETVGTITITVSYEEDGVTRTVTFDVTVNDAPVVLDSIAVSGVPDKTSYTVGDVLDLEGLEITATYSDGSSAEVSGYTTYPANGTVFSAAGIVTISITYTEGGVERTTAFNVTVAKATGSVLDCIGVTTLPYKTVYFVGEALDITGLVVSSTYTDGTTEEAVGYTTDPIDGAILDKIGRIPVIIVYTVGSVTKYSLYTVTVNALPAEPVLESIAVTTLPDKIVYTVGDVLDLTGMSVTAVLSSRNTGPAFYTTDPADGTVLSTEGTITITVSYTFFEVTATATFDVTVNPAACPDPVLESIAVTAMPAKTSYTVGDMLNLAGLEITAVYDDGSSAVVTSFVTDTANGAVLAAGTLTVTVTYIEDGITATTAFTVTVNTAPVEPPVINVPPVIVVILVAVVLIFTLLRR